MRAQKASRMWVRMGVLVAAIASPLLLTGCVVAAGAAAGAGAGYVAGHEASDGD